MKLFITIVLFLFSEPVRAAMIKGVAGCEPRCFAEAKAKLGVTYATIDDPKATRLAIAAGLTPVQTLETVNHTFPDLRDGGAAWEARCSQICSITSARLVIVANEPQVGSVLEANGQIDHGTKSDVDNAARIVVQAHRIAATVARRRGMGVLSGGFNLGKDERDEYPNLGLLYACLDAGLGKYIDKLAIHYGPDGSQETDPAFTALCASLRVRSGKPDIWNTETNYGDKHNPPKNNPSTAIRNLWSCNSAAGIKAVFWYNYGMRAQSPPMNLDVQNLGATSGPGFDAPALRATFRALN